MDSIAQFVHVRKHAKAAISPHGLLIRPGSCDRWQEVNSSNLRGEIEDGRIKGLSRNALARLKRALATTEHKDGPYHIYGLCYSIPWAGATQEQGAMLWRDYTNHLSRVFDRYHIGLIYRVELQTRAAPHWHMVVYLPDAPFDDDSIMGIWRLLRKKARGNPHVHPPTSQKKGRLYDGWYEMARPRLAIGGHEFAALHYSIICLLRALWIISCDKIHKNLISATGTAAKSAVPVADIKSYEFCVDSIPLNGLHSAIAYLATHTSKHKQEQLGWTGKQWGIVGQKWLKESVSAFDSALLSDKTRISAFRILRKWARSNRRKTLWPIVRPRDWLDTSRDESDWRHLGLTIRNARDYVLFGIPESVVCDAFGVPRGTFAEQLRNS